MSAQTLVIAMKENALELVPEITRTRRLKRARPFSYAPRHSIHAMQPDIEILKAGRPKYSTDPDSLIAASHVVAIEFATIAAANNYWRP